MNTVIKVLQCICVKCGKIRYVNKDNKTNFGHALQIKHNRRRLNEIVKILKKVNYCKAGKDEGDPAQADYCKSEIPRKIYKKDNTIKMEYKEESIEEELTAENCLKLFMKIKIEEANILGFTKNAMP